MLREKLITNNDDYEFVITENVPLWVPSHAPRFKIIDNQANSRDPSILDPKLKEHRQYNPTKIKTQKAISKNWHIELPNAAKVSNMNAQSLDLKKKITQEKLDFTSTVRAWKPTVNVDTSAENGKHLNNLSSNSKDDTASESEMVESKTLNKKGIIIELPTFNREAIESENKKVTTNILDGVVFEAKKKNFTMTQKNPYYKPTLRTWEPDSTENSDLTKLEYSIAARMDSSGNETDSSENTEDLNDLAPENTLRLDEDSEISEDKVEETTSPLTLPMMNTKSTEITNVFNKQSDHKIWHTWEHFIKYNRTTRLSENVRSTNTEAPDYNDYKHWKFSREESLKITMETPPTQYFSEKIEAMHFRVGSDSSEIQR